MIWGTYIKAIILLSKAIKQQMPVDLLLETQNQHVMVGWKPQYGIGVDATIAYLLLDQSQIDKQHDEIMLNVFIGKTLASRTLCKPDTTT